MSSYLQKAYRVNLCYCDESGTGDEPIAVMTGIIVDASRMHVTKVYWESLLGYLSHETGHQVVELHTRNLYSGNGVFRALSGDHRASIITAIFTWLAERKHHVVYSSVLKSAYGMAFDAQNIPDELNTIWRFLGFHIVLAMQKHCQREKKNKGHTIFIFDHEEKERMRFTDIIKRPQDWSDAYYDRGRNQGQLDQIVDVPYFGDSAEVSLIQLADFTSYFLRRYAEVKEGLIAPRYADEEARLEKWIGMLMGRAIPASCIYPRHRERAESIFYNVAPQSIRDLR